MVYHSIPWNSMGVIPWDYDPMEHRIFHGFPWNTGPMEFHGMHSIVFHWSKTSWFPMVFPMESHGVFS